MLVFINVPSVIVIDEIVVANLLVSNKGYQGQRRTNQNDGKSFVPLVYLGITYSSLLLC